MPDQISIQIRFTKTDESGIQFSDALYYSLSQYFTLTPQDIEDAKEERFINWKLALAAAESAEPLPVAEEQVEE